MGSPETKRKDLKVLPGTGNQIDLPDLQTMSLALEIHELNQTLKKVFGAFSKLKAKPVVVNGQNYCFVSKSELAGVFGVSENTISSWTSKGILPRPFDPERDKNGRKLLRWDVFECLAMYRKWR